MIRTVRLAAWVTILALTSSWAFSQDELPPAQGQYRKLVPGVMQGVHPNRQLDETFSRHDVVELIAVDPNWNWASDEDFRRPIWQLDFEFKMPRMIWVDLPQPSGMMQRKLVWYLVYTVTNNGKAMVPVQDENLPYASTDALKTVRVVEEDHTVRFIPEFLLVGHNRLKDGEGFTKAYPDRVIPLAVRAIQQREDPNRKLLNTAEMCREITPGETLWGVATWEDIDPRIVRFEIFVKGLTNAYRWKDDPSSVKADGTVGAGRRFATKTLRLNFWRPGDEYFEHEGEVRLGVPGGVDYEWVYR
ncbi:MAG: hypothetical protein ACOY3P_20625 [Planctomycetota bacterium]